MLFVYRLHRNVEKFSTQDNGWEAHDTKRAVSSLLRAAFDSPGAQGEARAFLFEQGGFIIHHQNPFFMLIPEVQPNINHYPFFEHDEEFNAWDMLDSFFTIFTLTDIRKSLFDMYEAALHDDWLNGNAKARHDLLYLYVRMNDLVTSAYVVTKEKYLQQQAEEKEKQSENSSPETQPATNEKAGV